MPPFSRLLSGAAAAHFADQLALAALPLAAVLVFGAGPGLVGILVAIQGAAWLLVSLPAGVAIDRISRSRLMALAQGIAAFAFLAAAEAGLVGSPAALALASFLGAGGAVVMMLAAMALVPTLVHRDKLATANGRLELARSLVALLAPGIAGLLAEHASPVLAFALAGAASALAAVLVFGLKTPAPPPAPRRHFMKSIAEGAAFAFAHPLLRGIVLCAVFWNFAYFALAAIAIPYGLQRLGLDPKTMGFAQSGYGLGLILGAMMAARLLARFEPRAILIGGPALSVLAAAIFLSGPFIGGVVAVFSTYFLIGFGPMLWLVCQISIRQIVTPSALLGRVASLVQVAIYGVRPLGALAGGFAASVWDLDTAMVLVIGAFSLSLLVPLMSALGRLRTMPLAQMS